MANMGHLPEAGKNMRERRTPKSPPRTSLIMRTWKRIIPILSISKSREKPDEIHSRVGDFIQT